MTRSKGPVVGVVRLSHGDGLALPAYQSEEAAGLDLVAAVSEAEPLTLAPGARVLVPTGLVLELPKGTEAQVRPRSGLAYKHGVTVLNAPGTIDSDYRGELKVLLINLGQEAFVIRRGDRIAQLVVAGVMHVTLTEKATAAKTRRGAGGFGSTGTKAAPGQPASASRAPKRTDRPAAPAKKKKSKAAALRPTKRKS